MTCRQVLPREPGQPPGVDRYCGQRARFFPNGWRCPDHTPARQAGHPEPPTTPMETR
ncbi:hypothetical protein ABT093_09950 [Kitasatospora sp. NPDC002551]|uniref:hypothetical protein n=1 Tax=Kitasatospora sp. NPDC002551 TaxID=3154539 RepID=UPI00331E36DC